MRHRAGVKENMNDTMDRKVSKFFGHVERMSDVPMTERVHELNVEGIRDRGRHGCWS